MYGTARPGGTASKSRAINRLSTSREMKRSTLSSAAAQKRAGSVLKSCRYHDRLASVTMSDTMSIAQPRALGASQRSALLSPAMV